MREKTCWRVELEAEMKEHNDCFAKIIANTMTENEMDVKFDSGYGGEEGIPFTVWTVTRVYFPICYDGSEWVGSVSRFPDGKPTRHQGGG